MATPYDIFRLATVESTQDEARTLLADGDRPALVVASHQLAGRGRQGRTWSQPDRGLYVSLALVSDWEAAHRTLIPLVAAVAIRSAVARRFEIEVGLKWPNDLMIGAKKVGGILVESSGNTIVVGCGMNLWWDDPLDGAASLLSEDPGGGTASRVAEVWAQSLLDHLDQGPDRWPRAEYEQASVTLAQEVFWQDGHGRAVGISDNGALVVDQAGIEVMLHSGEVHTRDPH